MTANSFELSIGKAMEEHLQDSIEQILLEAEQASDAETNGLMDRIELQEVIVRLNRALRRAIATCRELEQERRNVIALSAADNRSSAFSA